MKLLLRLFFFFFLLSVEGFSQLLTNNNVGITINSGAQLTVKGDVLNNAGATYTNAGTIDLSGNYTNNAGNTNFGTSTGTVILNGANQSILGSSSTTFNNLTLLGSGTKTLGINTTVGGGNVTPSGVLNIGTRALSLNGKILSISNSATNAIQSTTGYILSESTDNSSVVKWTINNTMGTHTIPFGTVGGVLIPVTYNLTAGNAGDVSVSTYPTNAANLPLPVTPTTVTHLRDVTGANNSANMPDRFWNIDKSGGSGVASLTFTYAPAENAINGNTNVRMQLWNSPQQAWEPPLIGQVNPTSQSVLVPGAAFSGVWGSALSGSPLPIELLEFTASLNNNQEVDLKWTTASEINNDYFTLERSVDGLFFESIAVVDGAGNSSGILNYKSVDKNPYEGVSFYRLKQTDFNGDYSYSSIETIKIETKSTISIYPNPASSQITVASKDAIFERDDFPIYLHDLLGQKISEFKIIKLSNQRITIDISHLAPGSYFISYLESKPYKFVKM
jgi:Secretion system C-terminal sorting domain